MESTEFGVFSGVTYLMETNENLINGTEMYKMACHIYQMLLKHLPAMVIFKIILYCIVRSKFEIRVVR